MNLMLASMNCNSRGIFYNKYGVLGFSLIECFQSYGMLVECTGTDESDVVH